MDKEENRNVVEDVIYLASCAVNGEIPDASRIEEMDLDNIYKEAQLHLVTGLVALALESAGIRDPRFIQARAKAIRKNMIMQADMEALFERLDKAGIWYMPLKGSLIERLYPAPGTRQMSDRDILIDGAYAEDIRAIMEDMGFSTEKFDRGNHDVYYKEPVSNFEIHNQLFGIKDVPEIYNYYQDVKSKLIKDEGNRFGYHFSDEDAYIYMIAHEYKHYSVSGTGLRSLLDTYVCCSHFGNSMDWGYISGEIAKLGISEFERLNRSLAMHLFNKDALNGSASDGLSDEELDMLGYVAGSGTYGNLVNNVNNKVNRLGGGRAGKARYVLTRLFPSMRYVKDAYPFFYRHKILLPALFVYRLGRGLFVSRAYIYSELKVMKKAK